MLENFLTLLNPQEDTTPACVVSVLQMYNIANFCLVELMIIVEP